MKKTKSMMTIVLLLINGLVYASSTHIVMLKSSFSTKTSSTGRVSRYTHARRAIQSRLDRELKPFVSSLGNGRVATQAVYLPLISGVGMNLSAEQVAELKKNPSVAKIIPNGKIFLDKPSRAVRVTARRGRSATPSEAMVLHGVDKLIEMGVDINKAGKTVGVIDTGVDGNHPDLSAKIARFKDFETGGTTPRDSDTHGTHVCGIIAGGTLSGTQIGVYPGAKLIVGSALSSYEDMVEALQWMLDPDGNPSTQDQPFVINNSWHIGSADATPFYAALQALKDADILIAFSAGNAGSSGITRPKEYPITYTTAAVNAKGVIASFSSWGPAVYQGQTMNKPEVASHGEDVMSTLPGNTYGRMSGTSMASPFTAGAVALLGAHFPNLSPYVIAKVLQDTAKRDGQAWHKQYGNGILDVHAAYMALKQQNYRR